MHPRSLRRFFVLVLLLGVARTVRGIKTMNGPAVATTQTTTPVVLPKTFRALVAPRVGTSFREVATVRELDMPEELQPNEVLIKVLYAGINGGCETFRARGEFDFESNQDERNFRLGAEGVGTVVSVGNEVERVQIGDTVGFVGAAFAEYTVAPDRFLWKLPPGADLAACVGLRISALTSCAMLEVTGEIRPGQTVLITAAAGGAGHFAVQLARLNGCTVIGTCGSDEKAELLKQLGCDHVIRYKTQNVKEELKRIAPEGLDAVLEGVGGEMLKTALECLGPEGKLLQIGYISEYPHADDTTDDNENGAASPTTDVDPFDNLNVAEIFWKKQTVTRGKQILYGNAWPRDYSKMLPCQDRVLDLYQSGKLRSVVDQESLDRFVGLESVSDAIEHMLGGSTLGKVVVKIQ